MSMPSSGNLKDLHLVELLHQVTFGQETGCLTIEEEPYRLHLYFEKGILRGVTSNFIPNLDIASILLMKGIITPEAGERLTERIRGADGAEEVVAEELKDIPPATMHSALRLQARSKFVNLFKWTRGRFTFDRDTLPPEPRILTGADMLSIVLKAVEKHLSPTYTREKLAQFKEKRIVRLLEVPLYLHGLTLPPEEMRFLEKLEDKCDIRQLFETTSLEPVRIYQLLIFLYAIGKATFVTPLDADLPLQVRQGRLTRQLVLQKIAKGESLAGAEMMDLDLAQVDFSGIDLSGANLQNANLRYANLRNANLSGANLYNADLSFADLRGVDLSNVNLTSAKVYKAKFEEKAAERVQLAEVTDDAEDTAREVTKIQYILTEVEEKQERRRYLTLVVVALLDLFILAGILYLLFFYG